VYDATDRTLFTSDLFMQPGHREAITSEDRSAEIVEFCRFSGFLPSQRHLEHALDRIEPLTVDTLACHHGSVLTGHPHRYYRALRQHVVGDIVDAPRRAHVTDGWQVPVRWRYVVGTTDALGY
jgi:flavorubredoxin